jgi:hypothetical protein
MTSQEWKETYDRLFAAFPGLYAWLLDSCPKDASNLPRVRETLEVWFTTLKAFSKQEVGAVIDSWITGTRRPPEAYQRELTAIIIRQSVLFDRSRNKPAEVDTVPAVGRRKRDLNAPSLAKAIAKALEAKASGHTDAECQAIMERELASFTVIEDHRRYKCCICFDSGLRHIWAEQDIEEIKRGELVEGDVINRVVCGCICDRGAQRSEYHAGWPQGKMARFDAMRHCPIDKDPFEFARKPRVTEWVA